MRYLLPFFNCFLCLPAPLCAGEALDPFALQLYASAVDDLNRAGQAGYAKSVQESLVGLKLIRHIPPSPSL